MSWCTERVNSLKDFLTCSSMANCSSGMNWNQKLSIFTDKLVDLEALEISTKPLLVGCHQMSFIHSIQSNARWKRIKKDTFKIIKLLKQQKRTCPANFPFFFSKPGIVVQKKGRPFPPNMPIAIPLTGMIVIKAYRPKCPALPAAPMIGPSPGKSLILYFAALKRRYPTRGSTTRPVKTPRDLCLHIHIIFSFFSSLGVYCALRTHAMLPTNGAATIQ